MSEQEVELTLDEVRTRLEAAAAASGVVLDFLMQRWNGRFATYNIGSPVAEVVDARRGVRDEARRYRLIGRLKAKTRGDGRLLLTLNPPTSCDLVPTAAEQALWEGFVATLRRELGEG